MKIRITLLATLLLAFSSLAVAQSKTKVVAPDLIVRNLYAAHKAGASPFFQTTNRALLDRYFTKKLADMIWQDALAAKGEVGAIEFDPLYGSQDPQITDFTIMGTGWGGDKKFGPEDEAVVQVTFKDSGKDRMVSYQFKQGPGKKWKIYDIHYRDDNGEVRLAETLTKATTAASPLAPLPARPRSKMTIEQLAQAISDAFTARDLGKIDAERAALGTIQIRIEHSISGERETKPIKSFAAGEQWFKSREREEGPARNSGPLQRCRTGVCTFEQNGLLHNNLYLQKITYGMKAGRPFIKAIYVIDGD